jgi:Biotin-protein ligase, N terminal
MTEESNSLDRTTVQRRRVRAIMVLAAIAICWAGATHFGERQSPLAPSSPLEAKRPILSPEVHGPILVAEPQEPILWPLAHEPIDSRAKPAAASRRIRVGLFSDKSCCDAPEPMARILEAIPMCKWEPVTAAEIRAKRVGRFDVVIFPGGGGRRQAAALGDEGRRAIRDFVRGGGGFVGICAGAFLSTAQYDWSLGLVNTRTLTGDRDMPGVGIRPMAKRGAGTGKIGLTEEGRAVFGDVRRPIDVALSGGPIFLGSMRSDLPPSSR